MRTLRRLATTLAVAIAFAGASVESAWAADDERGRPWARGTWMVGFGPGLGFGSDVTQLHLELGGRYFVVNGLAVGLTAADTILFYSQSLRNEFPGIQKRLPTNAVRLVPHLQYVFYRNRWFSPYVLAGVGPAFMNHGSGTHGYWRAMPGAYIGLGHSGVFLDIGVQFDGMFPVGRCLDAITDDVSGAYPGGLCTFGWGPHIGIAGAFGGRGRRGERRSRATPPRNPLPEAAPPQESAPREATPSEATPGAATPSEATPGAATPSAATPGAATPGAATPRETTPREATPSSETPRETTPSAATPSSETTPSAATPSSEATPSEPLPSPPSSTRGVAPTPSAREPHAPTTTPR